MKGGTKRAPRCAASTSLFPHHVKNINCIYVHVRGDLANYVATDKINPCRSVFAMGCIKLQ